MSRVCPSGQPAALLGKRLNVGHCTQTIQPNFFIPGMLVGTIDSHHFILLSLTFILSGGHKVRAKQSLLASVSQTLFIWSG